MSDENKLIRDAGNGVRARQLLEEELLVDAFKMLEDAYTLAWRNTKIDDHAGREKLFLAVNVVGKVRDHLQSAVINGKLAQAELDEIARANERRRIFGII
ncbi:hypothetical protein AOQ73_05835 [Bradyrhizobium pachyrhizi]|uniref:hypothetical protein n=1 Tax=Bradyrhizobium pachyrhizi TaxID=280333 RepID=UPI0007050C0D|nr:hypothetical protein [Bradyrhizobium pachyrhizi]KRQ11927.1 hypothetical protein AOQ73_05835 [Bradyrhizobium pachyrhizi]